MKCCINLQGKIHKNVNMHHNNMKQMIILFPSGEEKAMETMDIRFEKDSIEIEGWLGVDRVTLTILALEITEYEVEYPDPPLISPEIKKAIEAKEKLLSKAMLIPLPKAKSLSPDEAEERIHVRARPEISKEVPKYVGNPSFNLPSPSRPTKIKSRNDRLRALRERMTQIYEDV